jgi:hypothetical protein
MFGFVAFAFPSYLISRRRGLFTTLVLISSHHPSYISCIRLRKVHLILTLNINICQAMTLTLLPLIGIFNTSPLSSPSFYASHYIWLHIVII